MRVLQNLVSPAKHWVPKYSENLSFSAVLRNYYKTALLSSFLTSLHKLWLNLHLFVQKYKEMCIHLHISLILLELS